VTSVGPRNPTSGSPSDPPPTSASRRRPTAPSTRRPDIIRASSLLDGHRLGRQHHRAAAAVPAAATQPTWCGLSQPSKSSRPPPLAAVLWRNSHKTVCPHGSTALGIRTDLRQVCTADCNCKRFNWSHHRHHRVTVISIVHTGQRRLYQRGSLIIIVLSPAVCILVGSLRSSK